MRVFRSIVEVAAGPMPHIGQDLSLRHAVAPQAVGDEAPRLVLRPAEQAQRFLSSHAMIYGYFRPRRHLMTAIEHRNARAKAFRVWRQETCVQMAA